MGQFIEIMLIYGAKHRLFFRVCVVSRRRKRREAQTDRGYGPDLFFPKLMAHFMLLSSFDDSQGSAV
ncbi:protein of unknown function [Methylocaldum szegediense]|uniref:Uncharacterized protein n=1 Tax=Methylocaldum szegediense TaxID=73780 RepID=A0ABN8X8F6_9GAMM|nr:protein of unknown function [Methylocaldum szegediense]